VFLQELSSAASLLSNVLNTIGISNPNCTCEEILINDEEQLGADTDWNTVKKEAISFSFALIKLPVKVQLRRPASSNVQDLIEFEVDLAAITDFNELTNKITQDEKANQFKIYWSSTENQDFDIQATEWVVFRNSATNITVTPRKIVVCLLDEDNSKQQALVDVFQFSNFEELEKHLRKLLVDNKILDSQSAQDFFIHYSQSIDDNEFDEVLSADENWSDASELIVKLKIEF